MAMIAAQCPDIAVTVCDLDAARIGAWIAGGDSLPIYEPGLAALVARAVAQGNLHFVSGQAEISEAVAAANIVFVAVNTPTKRYGLGESLEQRSEVFSYSLASACTQVHAQVHQSRRPTTRQSISCDSLCPFHMQAREWRAISRTWS